MSSLADFQRQFVKAVLTGEGDEPYCATRGFEVYRRNVVFAAADSFRLMFPSATKVLGEKNLQFFVREFIKEVPPRTSDWTDTARAFPGFLGGRTELSGTPPILDLAMLDWLVSAAIRRPHQASTAIPSINVLETTDDLASIGALRTRFPVVALWRRFRGDSTESEPLPNQVPSHWVCVVRRDGSIAIEIVLEPDT